MMPKPARFIRKCLNKKAGFDPSRKNGILATKLCLRLAIVSPPRRYPRRTAANLFLQSKAKSKYNQNTFLNNCGIPFCNKKQTKNGVILDQNNRATPKYNSFYEPHFWIQK